MANKVLLKKSSVAAKVPLATDLDYGELALNYTDEKLYFKNASNVIKSISAVDTSSFATLTGTQTLTNKTISGASNTLSNIGNSSLTNSSVTIGSTAVSLGATATTLAGLTSVTSTTFVGALTGNASTATSATNATNATNASQVFVGLASANSAFKVPFADTTVNTAGNYTLLQDTESTFTYNPSTNTLTAGTFSGAGTSLTGTATSLSIGGNAATATSAATLTTARAINGVNFNGSAAITVPLNTTNRTTNETGHMVFTGTTATGDVSAYTNTAVRVNPSQGRVEANGISAAAGLIEHANNITVTYTMKTGNNAISAGPVTIDTGGSITIPDGSTWIIVSPT
jgi:hypothetical protein